MPHSTLSNRTTAILCAVVLCLPGLAEPSADPANSIHAAIRQGEFTARTRVFYMYRDYDDRGRATAEATTAGGIFKYQTATYKNLRAAIAYYGSHSLNFTNRTRGIETSLLIDRGPADPATGEDISFVGEAYIQANLGPTVLTLGRQRLNTPLANDHDLRLLPTSYDALTWKTPTLADCDLEIGYIDRYSGFVSRLSRFDDANSEWGEDGLAYLYATIKRGPVAFRGQYVEALTDNGRIDSYLYADAKIDISVGNETYVATQFGQTLYSDRSTNNFNNKRLNGQDDSDMYGLKIGTRVHPKVDVSLLYNEIDGNDWRAVESGPMYSDWQQGYGRYEASSGVGGQATFYVMEALNVKVGYVDVDADGNKAANTDEFAETNLDLNYKIMDNAKIRFRYSNKNQHKNTTRGDRDDIRVVLYFDF